MDSSEDARRDVYIDSLRTNVSNSADILKAVSQYIGRLFWLGKQDRDVARKQPFHWLYMRAMLWMESLERLDSAEHIQAVTCATRSLLEISIDMVLLHSDKTEYSANKMNSWQESAKLKFTQLSMQYAQRQYSAGSTRKYPDYSPFISRSKEKIEESRKAYWPQKGVGRHPERWTGNNSLLVDAKSADKLFGEHVVKYLDGSLEKYYETEYRRLNWYVHGSAASGYNIDVAFLYLMVSTSFLSCIRLALLCSDVHLREIDLDLKTLSYNPYDDLDYILAFLNSWGHPPHASIDNLRLRLGCAHTQ